MAVDISVVGGNRVQRRFHRRLQVISSDRQPGREPHPHQPFSPAVRWRPGPGWFGRSVCRRRLWRIGSCFRHRLRSLIMSACHEVFPFGTPGHHMAILALPVSSLDRSMRCGRVPQMSRSRGRARPPPAARRDLLTKLLLHPHRSPGFKGAITSAILPTNLPKPTRMSVAADFGISCTPWKHEASPCSRNAASSARTFVGQYGVAAHCGRKPPGRRKAALPRCCPAGPQNMMERRASLKCGSQERLATAQAILVALPRATLRSPRSVRFPVPSLCVAGLHSRGRLQDLREIGSARRDVIQWAHHPAAPAGLILEAAIPVPSSP